MSLSDDQITQIRERLQKIGDGEWVWNATVRSLSVWVGRFARPIYERHPEHNWEIADADAEFIAAAPKAITDLLALVDQLRQQSRACACLVPDPVMQADMRFYCHTCSFQTGARPHEWPEMEAMLAARRADTAEAACARLRTALEGLKQQWQGMMWIHSGDGALAFQRCANELEAALSLPEEGTQTQDQKAESSQR